MAKKHRVFKATPGFLAGFKVVYSVNKIAKVQLKRKLIPTKTTRKLLSARCGHAELVPRMNLFRRRL
jgi:hypothetical protein